jgi:hypothetical protein
MSEKRTLWRFLKNLEIELPYNTLIPLLGIYLKECKTGYSRDICTLVFITALFTIAKPWKQARNPKTYVWIMKLCYIYTMGYNSAARNNDMDFEGKWMQLRTTR